MPWVGILEGFLVVILLAVLPIVLFAARRRWLARRGSMFECSLRLGPARAEGSPRGWALGAARYHGDELEWFRVFSLAFGPRERITRRGTRVLQTRAPDPTEAVSLYRDQQVVTLAVADGRQFELGMACASITGLLAWLEAAPPDRTHPV